MMGSLCREIRLCAFDISATRLPLRLPRLYLVPPLDALPNEPMQPTIALPCLRLGRALAADGQTVRPERPLNFQSGQFYKEKISCLIN